MKNSPKKWFWIILSIFILATIAMTVIGSSYNISWLVNSIQKIRFLPDEFLEALYKYDSKNFITYFVIDSLFFASTFCFLIYSTTVGLIRTGLATDKVQSFVPYVQFKWIDKQESKKYRQFSILLSVVLLAAFVFDLVENYQFVSSKFHKPSSWIVTAKTFCYGFGMLCLLYALIEYLFAIRFKEQLENRAKTLPYNWMSILIVVLTFVLLYRFSQGGALMFDLFDHPVQMLFCLALITLLIFFIWQFPDELVQSKAGSPEDLAIIRELNRPIRRILALVFTLGLLFACCNIMHQNWISYGSWINPFFVTLLLGGFYAFLYRSVNKVYTLLKKPKPSEEENKFLKTNFFWAVFCLEISVAAIVVLGTILMVSETALTHCVKLSILTFVIFFLGCIFIALSPKRSDDRIPLFNIFMWRSLFKNLKPDDSKPLADAKPDPKSARVFIKEKFWKISVGLAIVNVIFLFAIYFCGWLINFNPLNILFSVLCMYYSLFLLVIYYKKEKVRLLPIAILLGVLAYYTSFIQDNNFHTLTPIENNGHTSFTEYVKNRGISMISEPVVDSLYDVNSEPPVFIIAADGGGLRGAYWNLLIMHKLDSLKQFYPNVFAATGVSGGAIGQGIFLYMNSRHFNGRSRADAIDKIGSANFLSNDLFGTFISSVALSLVPGTNCDRLDDRAEIMEHNYLRLINDDELAGKKSFLQTPFDNYWEGSSRLPLLFPLSVQIEKGQRAFPSPVSGLSKYGIGIGAIDITNIESSGKKSLAFADALFTSNRFPLFSPGAKIGNLGHFVDGGYFDNSSVFTAVEIINFLKKYTRSSNIHVIRIRNSKDVYIEDQFKDWRSLNNPIKNNSEQGVILSGAINSGLRGMLDWGDEYLKSDSDITVHYFDLPFLLDKGEVQDVLGRHLLIDQDMFDARIANMDSLYHLAITNCENFGDECNCLQQPPLGRILSKNVKDQMKCLLDHEEIRRNIEAIWELL